MNALAPDLALAATTESAASTEPSAEQTNAAVAEGCDARNTRQRIRVRPTTAEGEAMRDLLEVRATTIATFKGRQKWFRYFGWWALLLAGALLDTVVRAVWA